MQLFTRLFTELDSTTRTAGKVAALERYFVEAPPEDAAWALYFLTGGKVKRAINTRLLRDWIAAEAQLPLWLVEESYDAVGDLAETIALLLPDTGEQSQLTLHKLVDERVVALKELAPEAQQELVRSTWRELDQQQRLVWHKLIMGEFRVGVARTLVVRALASVAGVPAETMAHRVMGQWQPTAADYSAILHGHEEHADPGRPYPFFLAHPLEDELEQLGGVDQWQLEWKWDGIRAQLIHRHGEVLVWSRGEELVTDRFPEVAEVGQALPDGVVLDGEIMAWRDERPLPFAVLQKRIGRKSVSAKLRVDAPVAFIAYDLLEQDGADIRSLPMSERRPRLEQLVASLDPQLAVRVSPTIATDSWDDVRRQHAEARERLVEGMMLKRRDAAYGVGRPKGIWWKWKTSPLALDAVLIYAQRGHGRRASLYTDYTFGVWHEGQLVPIAKAYSGLTDEEIRDVDRFVRDHTIDKFGPVRAVTPELVFELHFEGVQISTRHKAGLAVRFPRMARWRHDKKPQDADTLEALRGLANDYRS